jgi:hypothetical protein
MNQKPVRDDLITLKITPRELDLLTALAADQLFRREFIDPKMPGHRANAGDIELGKALIARLRLIRNPGATKKLAAVRAGGTRN